jgi:hypothetical protein
VSQSAIFYSGTRNLFDLSYFLFDWILMLIKIVKLDSD